jgi:hypothetical protein
MSARWWAKFERDPITGCLLWTGTVNKHGYGRSKGNGPAEGEVYVHRIVYLLLVGPIPEGQELDHVKERGCAYRNCAEVSHLEPVTHGENQRRSVRAICKWGHVKEGRTCRMCNRETQRRFREEVVAGKRKPPPSWIAAGYVDKTS